MIGNPEAAVVGMCLRDAENLQRFIALGISPAHFDDQYLREIFVEMLIAEREGRSYASDALTLHIPRRAVEIMQAELDSPLSIAPEYIAEEIHARCACRRVVDGMLRASHLATHRQPFESMTEIQSVVASLPALVSGHAETKLMPRHSADVLHDLTESLETRILERDKGKSPGITSGIRLLDKFTSGFHPGRYYVLGARTSMGKTTFALNCALSAAKAGAKTAIFTVEMDCASILTKLVACEAGINSERIDNAVLSDDELDRYMAATRTLSQLPIFVQDRFDASFDKLRLGAEMLRRKSGLDFLVVDYVQQLHLEGLKSGSSYERVSRVSRELQRLAESLRIPVFALAQMNRDAAKDEIPGMHQIKESGAIEQDANVVMVLYRQQENLWLQVAKNRHGRTGAFPLQADLALSRFSNASVNERAYD